MPTTLGRHQPQAAPLLLLLSCLGSSETSDDSCSDTPTDTGVVDTGVVDTGTSVDLTGASVTIIVVDTLRASHMGWAGYTNNPATPNLDTWGEGAAVWTAATSAGLNTGPGTAALLTGLHGNTTEVTSNSGIVDDAYDTAAELFQAAGYTTIGISANPIVNDARGFNQGWDSFSETEDPRLAEDIVDDALAALDGIEGPVFTYLHFFDPHEDYSAPEPWFDAFDDVGTSDFMGTDEELTYWDDGKGTPTEADIARLYDLYDGEIAYMDNEMARLLDGLPEGGVVVFTSDHGEQFGEHGGYFHKDPHPENTDIPLAVAAPGVAPAVSSGLAGTVDILPTIGALVGVTGEHWQGVDLLAGDAPHTYTARGSTTIIQRDGYRFVRQGSNSLYDMTSDPGAFDNVKDEYSDVTSSINSLRLDLEAECDSLRTSIVGK